MPPRRGQNQQPGTIYETGWSREAQKAAEDDFPPPEEPQDEPKVRSVSRTRLALILLAVSIAWVTLVALLRPDIIL
jgi:hypothetical protein